MRPGTVLLVLLAASAGFSGCAYGPADGNAPPGSPTATPSAPASEAALEFRVAESHSEHVLRVLQYPELSVQVLANRSAWEAFDVPYRYAFLPPRFQAPEMSFDDQFVLAIHQGVRAWPRDPPIVHGARLVGDEVHVRLENPDPCDDCTTPIEVHENHLLIEVDRSGLSGTPTVYYCPTFEEGRCAPGSAVAESFVGHRATAQASVAGAMAVMEGIVPEAHLTALGAAAESEDDSLEWAYWFFQADGATLMRLVVNPSGTIQLSASHAGWADPFSAWLPGDTLDAEAAMEAAEPYLSEGGGPYALWASSIDGRLSWTIARGGTAVLVNATTGEARSQADAAAAEWRTDAVIVDAHAKEHRDGGYAAGAYGLLSAPDLGLGDGGATLWTVRYHSPSTSLERTIWVSGAGWVLASPETTAEEPYEDAELGPVVDSDAAAGVGNHTNTGVGNEFDMLRSGHGYGDRPVWNVRWSTPGMWSTRWVDATNGALIHEGLAVA